jgi:ankyrin repeat protein
MGWLNKFLGGSLISATRAGNVEKVRELLQNGSDANEKKNGFSALMYACERGDLDVVRLLVEHGADVNAREPGLALTPMMAAASGKGFQEQSQKEARALEIVDLLVKNGADVNAAGTKGQTAMFFAAESDHRNIIRFLEEHGARS